MLGFFLFVVFNIDYEVSLEEKWREEKRSAKCTQDVVGSVVGHKNTEGHG